MHGGGGGKGRVCGGGCVCVGVGVCVGKGARDGRENTDCKRQRRENRPQKQPSVCRECWLRKLHLLHASGPESARCESLHCHSSPGPSVLPQSILPSALYTIPLPHPNALPPTVPTSQKEHPRSQSLGLLGALARPPVVFLFPL